MSIIKGKTNIVAGFGGTKRPLGEVYFSQSSLASDNPGALPGWTGEYYENGKTLFPDLYNFVKAHSELQVTKTQYDSAIATYGECPKYVVDETTTSTSTVVKIQFPQLTYPIYTKQPEFFDVDGYNYANEIGYLDENLTEVLDKESPTETNIIWQHNSTSGKYNVYSMYNPEGSTGIPSIETDSNYQNSAIDYNYIATKTTTIEGSLRLPKLANYIKMANSTEGITQKGAGLPDHDHITHGKGSTSGVYLSNIGSLCGRSGGETVSHADAPAATMRTGDASESNPIYGASDTVQPAHTTLYPWISAYTSVVPASTAQAAEFTGALSGKANTDLSNVLANIDYVVESQVNSDGSWYRKYKSGWLEQGGKLITGTGDYTFLKPYASLLNVTIQAMTTNDAGASNAGAWLLSPGPTNTGFQILSNFPPTYYNSGYWYAVGQGAN